MCAFHVCVCLCVAWGVVQNPNPIRPDETKWRDEDETRPRALTTPPVPSVSTKVGWEGIPGRSFQKWFLDSWFRSSDPNSDAWPHTSDFAFCISEFLDRGRAGWLATHSISFCFVSHFRIFAFSHSAICPMSASSFTNVKCGVWMKCEVSHHSYIPNHIQIHITLFTHPHPHQIIYRYIPMSLYSHPQPAPDLRLIPCFPHRPIPWMWWSCVRRPESWLVSSRNSLPPFGNLESARMYLRCLLRVIADSVQCSRGNRIRHTCKVHPSFGPGVFWGVLVLAFI